jgi:CHAT domain-containing protein
MISVRLVEEEHKIGFQARTSDAYRYMIPLCKKLGKEEEAFEYVERSKSRAFLEMLAATDFRPIIEMTDELELLLDEEESHLARMREIQMRHLRQSQIRVEPGEVERIHENLNQIYDKIENIDPEYVYVRRGRPLSLDELRDMLPQQKRDVVLIEYFTTPEETYIFLVSSRDKELHVKTVPLSENKLRLYFENYWREVVNHPRYGDIGESWLALGEYLIDPVSEHLTEGDLVYFVPHGVLHYLPLHALRLNEEPLIVNHPVSYSPSVSLIRFCRNKGSGKLQTCASFGVVFEEEAEEVARLFDSEPHGDPRATNEQVMEYCTGKDVIHFSCHGKFDDVDPLSSGIELHGGVLTARKIFGMRLDSELVTLSACQTGLNERSPGDELIGLTRAFLYAGSPSVVVSLWSVDPQSTQELMLEFYGLLLDGHSIAEALQEAQKRMVEREEYYHPYYWAPFILVGDWE